MIPYFHKTPGWLKSFYPSFTWSKITDEKIIYLTFDDGPIPGVTPLVLNHLSNHDAKGTFFCVGDNVRKNKQVFKEVVAQGHSIGNHTYHHLNGWNTDSAVYLKNVEKCENIFNEEGVTSRLFRPPHGRIRKKQSEVLNKCYEIVMWSHLSGDFDQDVNLEKSKKEMKQAGSGSILVFHDSLKAADQLQKLLPDILLYFYDLGFKFKSL